MTANTFSVLEFFTSKTTSDPSIDDCEHHFTKNSFSLFISHGVNENKMVFMKVYSGQHAKFDIHFNCEMQKNRAVKNLKSINGVNFHNKS